MQRASSNMRSLSPQREPAPPSWVLASASPRRIAMLRESGQTFDVVPSGVEERRRPGEPARIFALRMAREKALDVAPRASGRWVLGADTVVVLDDEPLGKPADPSDAVGMLRRLSGRSHAVVTAFALADPAGRLRAERAVETLVAMRRLEPEEIERYVRTGEPLDKAGAYAIQGLGAPLIDRVEGDFFGVMGLPLRLALDLLARFGRPYRFTR